MNINLHIIYICNLIERIGHLSHDIFQLKNLFMGYNSTISVVSEPIDNKPRVNKAFYNIVMRGLNTINVPDISFPYLANSKMNNIVYVQNDKKIYAFVPQSYLQRIIFKQFKNQSYKFYYCLTKKEMLRGKKIKIELGIPEKSPIITLHVRSSEYLPDSTYHQYRDAEIEDYIPAIKHLIKCGFYVIRIGNKKMKKIFNAPSNFIDLPFHPAYTDLADPYLIAESNFFIGTNSGPTTIAYAMGKPVLLTNANILSTNQSQRSDLIIYKKLYSNQLDRYLTYEEIIQSPVVDFFEMQYYTKAGLKIVNNTSEEILMATKEMIAIINGYKYPEIIFKLFHKRIEDIHEKAYHSRQNKKYIYRYGFGNRSFHSKPYDNSLFLSDAQISFYFFQLNPKLFGHDFRLLENTHIEKMPSINKEIKTFWDKGFFSLSKNEFEKAESYFRKVLSVDINNADAFYFIGMIAHKQNKFEKAIEFLLSCLKITLIIEMQLSVYVRFIKKQSNLILF